MRAAGSGDKLIWKSNMFRLGPKLCCSLLILTVSIHGRECYLFSISASHMLGKLSAESFTLFCHLQRAVAREEENADEPKATSQMNTDELRERVENLESLVRTLYAMNATRISNEIASIE